MLIFMYLAYMYISDVMVYMCVLGYHIEHGDVPVHTGVWPHICNVLVHGQQLRFILSALYMQSPRTSKQCFDTCTCRLFHKLSCAPPTKHTHNARTVI